MMAGAQLADRMDEMESAEFLDTLSGSMSQDYVVSNKVNVRTMDDVKSASFRVNPAMRARPKDAVYPSRRQSRRRADGYGAVLIFPVSETSRGRKSGSALAVARRHLDRRADVALFCAV